MNIDSVYWHDGILHDIQLSLNEVRGFVILQASVYLDSEAPSRSKIAVRFEGVLSYQSSLDVIELLDNRIAGNISNCYLKPLNVREQPQGGKFRMFFSDGYIEIISNEIHVYLESGQFD